MNYRWIINESTNEDTVKLIAQTQNIPQSVAKILISRGIETPEDAYNFFHPSLSDLHSPYLMDGMEKAVKRIQKAIDDREIIWVYGDYDVDGTASTAMLLHFLRDHGSTVDYYIPDRFSEGYGVSCDGIDQAKANGVSLILCVDSGVTSVQPIKYSQSLGIDFIVCDHHEPADQIPEAYALLDPIKGTCNYPFKYLCASGVVFKLIQALCMNNNEPERAYKYLDFVAVASAADMVPLVGENRTLVYHGLKLLNAKPRPGLRGLMECIGIRTGSITSSTIIYNLAPRINAAGRLGDARKAVELLLADDDLTAFRLAQDLESKNHQRRVIDEETFTEAKKMADDLIKSQDYRSLVLYNPDWHVGVINIVASRMVETYNLPTIMLTNVDSIAKGSARSIKNFDVHSALKQCQIHIREFGGHKYAAGLSVEEINIPALRTAFDGIAHSLISEEMLTPELHIDTELHLNELSPRFIEMIEMFAPFGYHNPKPVFVTHNVQSARRATVVGKNHLKFRARQGNFLIDAIGFNLGDRMDICNSSVPFSIVYTIEETYFHNRKNLQLYIKDLRPSHSSNIVYH